MSSTLAGLFAAALPLLLAAALPFLPPQRWLPPAVAFLGVVAALAWLWPSPPSAPGLVLVLAQLAWLVASVCDALEPGPAPSALQAAMAGGVTLAALLPGPALIMAAAGASLAATAQRPALTLLGGAALGVTGNALGLPVLGWAGLGVVCLRPALSRTPLARGIGMLAGPLAGVWVVRSLGMPHGPALAGGVAGLTACAVLMRGWSLHGVLVLAMAAFAAAAIGAGAPGAALLHVLLGCLALLAALTSGLPAALGAASLAGVPPLGVFASVFTALLQAAAPGWPGALLLTAGFAAVLLAAFPALPRPGAAGPAAPLGWAALALTLAAAWALPQGAAQWLAVAAQ